MSEIDRELQAWLKTAPAAVRSRVSSRIRAQAERLAAAQRAALARQQQPPEETGGLLESVRVEQGKNDTSFIVRAGGPLSTKDGYDHALAFEFGTSRQPARPFFYSTARALNTSMRREIESAVGDALDGA